MYGISRGTDFIYKSIPGYPGYGEDGKKGKSGPGSHAVHFSVYTSYQQDEIKNAISNSHRLTDNPELAALEENYSDGDFILTSDGSIFSVTISGSEISLTNTYSIFGEDSINAELSCENVTDTGDFVETYSFMQRNYDFEGDYDERTSSPYYFHRSKYSISRCGNWYKFSVTLNEADDSEENYTYKFAIQLPDGREIIKYSEYKIDYLFIDNENVYPFAKSGTVNINYNGIENNIEHSKSVSEQCADLITENCKFSVEIMSKINGKTYKIYKSQQ